MEVLNLVRQQVRSVEFRTWIKPVQPAGFENGTITLHVRDAEFQRWFSDHYESLVERALEKVLQKPVQIAYRVQNPELFEQPVLPDIRGPARFESDYTFDNFIVGPSNHMAYAAAKAVAERPGRAYNPLFFYGGTGLGKTHLLYAVGAAAQQRNPRLRVLYITVADYLNDLTAAIRQKRMEHFRVKYRDACDMLLVDDIQFISGKERTQEEFFHAFNALYAAHKQIVVSSDRPPAEIPDIEDRLVSRFEWGLIADIKAPELETRMAILSRKAELTGLPLPHDVVEFVAKEVTDNVRELESSLNRLRLEAQTQNAPISVKMARDSLKAYFRFQARRLSPEAIQKAVAQKFGVDCGLLASASRKKEVALPRHVAMYLVRRLTALSFPEIGQRFGGRDHSSVISGIRKIEKSLKVDQSLVQGVEELEQRLRR